MFIGTGAALAGGSSSTTGQGLHCYMLFNACDNGGFAQVMIYEEGSTDCSRGPPAGSGCAKLKKRYEEIIDTYGVGGRGCTLATDFGNAVGLTRGICETP